MASKGQMRSCESKGGGGTYSVFSVELVDEQARLHNWRNALGTSCC